MIEDKSNIEQTHRVARVLEDADSKEKDDHKKAEKGEQEKDDKKGNQSYFDNNKRFFCSY